RPRAAWCWCAPADSEIGSKSAWRMTVPASRPKTWRRFSGAFTPTARRLKPAVATILVSACRSRARSCWLMAVRSGRRTACQREPGRMIRRWAPASSCVFRPGLAADRSRGALDIVAVGESRLVHGTAIALKGRAALIRGESGSGKSDLALRCVAQPASDLISGQALLVADDQVRAEVRGGKVHLSCPETIKGLIEVRGLGIVAVPAQD